MNDNKKKIFRVFLTIFLTVFFIYIFFPFTLIKEVAVTKIQQVLNSMDLGLVVRVDSLSTYWFTGLQLKGIRIENQNSSKDALEIDSCAIRLSVLPLFMGRINVVSSIKMGQGEGLISASLSLIDLISQKTNIKDIEVDFNQFQIDGFTKQLINVVKNSKDPGLSLLIPIVQNSSLGGYINGHMLYQNKENYVSKINFKLNNAYLDINNETLGIPKQTFSKANIDMDYGDSTLTIKKDTAFIAQNISISPTGTIKTGNMKNSDQNINIKLNLEMSGQIEKNFGFLIPQILKCPSSSLIGGIMKVNLTGSAQKLNCSQ